MKHLFLSLLFSMFFLSSCINRCQTCTLGEVEVEICDDDEIDYTDANGNPIGNYRETIQAFEDNGYDCN